MQTRLIIIKRSVFIILALLYINNIIAQGQTVSQNTLPILNLKNTQVVVTLDSLIKFEKQCKEFDSTLIWTLTAVSDTTNNKYTIEITMVSTAYHSNPYGYFYRDETLCIALGKRLDDLFAIGKTKKKFYFKQKQLPYPEDYSVWYYYFSPPHFILKEAYPLKCE